MSCLFCEYKKNPADLIIRTKYWIIILAYNQQYLGRSIIFLNRHVASLSDLTVDEWKDFESLAKIMELALKKSFNATMFNWTCLTNDAYKVKPYNAHLHWHFRPRYDHEVEFASKIFRDKNFGHHYERNDTRDTDESMQRQIVLEIQKNLDLIEIHPGK